MKYLISSLLLLTSSLCEAQLLNYFKVQMGPKYDIYNGDGGTAIPHVNVAAGATLGKLFTENIYAEVGVYKNDYTANIQLTDRDLNEVPYTTNEKILYPTFTSTQLGGLVGYRFPIDAYDDDWIIYVEVGVHNVFNKKLSREGSQTLSVPASTNDGFTEQPMDVIIFSNGNESGSLIFKGNMGVYRKLNENLAADISISGRFSNLPLNEFQVEYALNGSNKQNAIFTTDGTQLGLYIGLKYTINKYSKY